MPAGLPDFLRDPEAPEALIGVPLERNWILHAYTRGYFPWPDPDGKVVWYNRPSAWCSIPLRGGLGGCCVLCEATNSRCGSTGTLRPSCAAVRR
ncbi:MAG: hypothetical protein R3E96_11015 [Planctomycetota bacterium]